MPKTEAPTTRAHPRHRVAAAMASAKAQHYIAPGDLELPDQAGYSWPAVSTPGRHRWDYRGSAQAGPDHCPGQLRTVYMRLTVGAIEVNGWKQKAGKPSWLPVGIACDSCLAFWPGDVDPAALAAPTNGR